MTRHECQRGQALIEVLVAAAIGVALAAALAQLFVASSRSQAAAAGQAALQESGRHALWFLRRSARSAGYLGCGTDGNFASGLNDSVPPPELAVAPAVSAFDGGGDRNVRAWQPSLAALPTKGGGAAFRLRNRIDPARVRPGSDVVAFRRMGVGVPLLQQMGSDLDPVVVADPDRSVANGNFAVISTCRQAALFRITSASRAGGATTLRRTAGVGLFANRGTASLLAAGWPYGAATGPAGAQAARPQTEIYFVGRRANDAGNPPAWGLWRKTGTAAPAELVPGIDDLQLLLGVDDTPDGGGRAPQRYATADAIGIGVARTLHVAVTAIAPAAGGEPQRRRTFAQTVALRN